MERLHLGRLETICRGNIMKLLGVIIIASIILLTGLGCVQKRSAYRRSEVSQEQLYAERQAEKLEASQE